MISGKGKKKKKDKGATSGTMPGKVSTTAKDQPKGAYAIGQKKYSTYKGKRTEWTYMGNGNWQGRPTEMPGTKKVKTQSNTNYDSDRSKKGKMRKKKKGKKGGMGY